MTPLHGEMVDDLPMLQAISDRQRMQLANPEACTMPDDEQRPVPLGKRTPQTSDSSHGLPHPSVVDTLA
jgi:hypothetical protein